ncbi:TLD domain-containing protein 2-like [Brevipalpus obovatus]|uniref:TLD domain-containing protein 2-like n=1 Tax=Brevipalpus obovatus TaxID=246614 RepID=UPI003D9EA216
MKTGILDVFNYSKDTFKSLITDNVATVTRTRSLGRQWFSQASRLISRYPEVPKSPSDYHQQISSLKDNQNDFTEVTEPPLPELIGESEILTEERRRCISQHLPARAVGYSWAMIYSTSQHGISLKTLYRTMTDYENPVLLIIQDTDDTVFGALTSTSLRTSDHFYGTGETFLFTFHPEFRCFPWTGENIYFLKGDSHSIAIGAGDGSFGLWLDGDLYHGSSNPCQTFGNTRLSKNQDFVVKTLECWGFV